MNHPRCVLPTLEEPNGSCSGPLLLANHPSGAGRSAADKARNVPNAKSTRANTLVALDLDQRTALGADDASALGCSQYLGGTGRGQEAARRGILSASPLLGRRFGVTAPLPKPTGIRRLASVYRTCSSSWSSQVLDLADRERDLILPFDVVLCEWASRHRDRAIDKPFGFSHCCISIQVIRHRVI